MEIDINKTNLACDIVDKFDTFLSDKDIKIKCEDENEELERCANIENSASLYGMEYWGLVDKVESVLDNNINLAYERGKDNYYAELTKDHNLDIILSKNNKNELLSFLKELKTGR